MRAPGREAWGVVAGRPVARFTLRNARGLVARVAELGAALLEVHAPDRDGRLADVVLGYDDPLAYARDDAYLGVVVGRVANRIAGASYEIDGATHALVANDGPHQLHGGPTGFHRALWTAEPGVGVDGSRVTFAHRSPAGDGGHPGAVDARVTYALGDDDVLRVEMTATCDAPTPVNLAQHAYWNLGGHDAGDVLAHELSMHASRWLPAEGLLPTGAIASVEGTPFDFRAGKPIGRDLSRLPGDGLRDPGGYDHCLVVDGAGLRPVARLSDPASGRVLELASDRPGVQLYGGNFLDGRVGKRGARYARHAGLCLETQDFPDAVHHRGEAGWPDVVLVPGATYRHVMELRFSVA